MTKYSLYNKMAQYYDLIYADKDYGSEYKLQLKLITQHKQSKGKDLLEVACGTGRYLEFYEKKFNCVGIDLNKEMLKIARKRAKKPVYKQADMLTLKLDKQFDVITCLFSSIGYIHGKKNLERVIQNFSDHLKPGGVLLISPWIFKENYKVGSPHLGTYQDDNIKLARAVISKVRNRNISVMNFNWIIAERGKTMVHVKNDTHELYMHPKESYLGAMKKSGIKGKLTRKNPTGRGLFVGVKT